jgi:hypothetical protein
VSWRYAFASAIGTSHSKLQLPCQDSCVVIEVTRQGESAFVVAIASDGAGSARYAQTGAEIACERASNHIAELLVDPLSEIEAIDPRGVLGAIRTAIGEAAAATQSSMRDFACTVVGSVIGREKALYFQIGDGAIVARRNDALECVFWPEGGEYANMTFFVTDHDADSHLQFVVEDAPCEVALLTDGLQRLALKFSDKSVHAPFFDPMFSVLRNTSPEDCVELSDSLGAFLNSEPINSRTDDDKTLVLISCQQGTGSDAAA